MPSLRYIVVICMLMMLFSCREKASEGMFTALDGKETGITFTNKLVPSPQFNLFSYMYYYNGAGVGVGDLNNDGLSDIFFAANRSGNALYLNRGGLQFEDVTRAAAVPVDSTWSTGVSLVDINNDGLLDIYICAVSNYKILKGKNKLLVCTGISNGIPRYEERAEQYGLAFSGYSTQAAFLDMDQDGDLDMFLLNHSVNHEGNYAPRKLFENTYDSLAGHRLYRNDQERGFTDITRQTGINSSKIGYGLGIAVSDINLDGWPDVYIGNDFHENDYLYINQRNGTFREEGTSRLKHTSQFSMGVDVADINNDAHPEIFSMDMLPYDPDMIRRSLAEDDPAIFNQKIGYGYTYQYARNNLQLNRGNGKFTEIGQYAGIFATDWSWSSLVFDFNNDARKDLFVSNGIPKRMNDIDYINFVSGEELQQKLREGTVRDKDLELINQFPEIKVPNHFFLNKGDLSFQNYTDSMSANPVSFSNGAAYADFDNDGDLDLVVNNINDPATIYRNNINKEGKTTAFARVELKGPAGNINALGAMLLVYSGSQRISYEHYPVHGFLSSMLVPLHVGMEGMRVDSALLIWPDQTYQRVELKPGGKLQMTYTLGLPRFDFGRWQSSSPAPLLEDITASTGISHQHQENLFYEFDREPLIPHKISSEGPALAVADINHDGLDDFFTGASKTFHGAVYLQKKNGQFERTAQPSLQLDSMWEATDAVWTDVNGDTHADLVIATGGNEFYGQDQHLTPLLYLNDGKGKLERKRDAFDSVFVTQSRVLPHDFNKDGKVDLLITGKTVPWAYGKTPRSYILINDGTGKFTDQTKSFGADLLNPGMVSWAEMVDMNGDGEQEIIMSYLWGGIDAFEKEGPAYVRKPIGQRKGWWQFFVPMDADGDGDTDIVAGNFGLNSRLKASVQYPARMYVHDFDRNGTLEQILTYYVKGKEIPFAGKLQLERSLPQLKKKYLYAADFSKATIEEMFGRDALLQSIKLEADCFEHVLLINKGKLSFEQKSLPVEAQLSSYRSAAVLNGGKLLLGGNFYDNNVEIGRMDGDYGLMLQFGKGGVMNTSLPGGVELDGEIRRMIPISIGGRKSFLIGRNNASLMVISERPGS